MPGSPRVAEHTVDLLGARTDVHVVVHGALSFLDLSWVALGIDPLDDDSDDIARVANLSGAARKTLVDYMSRLDAGESIDHDPCCWYDPDTKGCRSYSERPNICRNFELSSEGCHRWRKIYDIT